MRYLHSHGAGMGAGPLTASQVGADARRRASDAETNEKMKKGPLG